MTRDWAKSPVVKRLRKIMKPFGTSLRAAVRNDAAMVALRKAIER